MERVIVRIIHVHSFVLTTSNEIKCRRKMALIVYSIGDAPVTYDSVIHGTMGTQPIPCR